MLRLIKNVGRWVCKKLYQIRARYEDWRLGRVSVDKIRESKFKDLGVKDMESTNYQWLDQMFKAFPYPKHRAFIDVGCGEGRVLTYLYLRGCRVPMIGIELDPDNAKVARERTKNCPNIRIECKNVLECGDIIKDAGEFYLFNPFTEDVMAKFIELVEENCKKPVVIYYCNDLYRHLLDKRPNWSIIWRTRLKSWAGIERGCTIFGYMPEGAEKK